MVQSGRYYTAQYNVHSFTDPDKEPYKVSQRADGGWECSCPIWIYRRKWLHNGRLIPKHERPFLNFAPNAFCKHIMFIRENCNLEEDARHYEETEERIEVTMDGRIKGFIDSLQP